MKNKHFFGVMIIAALLLVSLLAYSSGQPVHAEENGNLVIIHTNDVHGYLEASDSCLGIAAVAALKNEYEENGYEVLLLDAGDALQGNIFVNQSDGENAVTLMNEVGYDAMALGNHEFDYGADVLEERIEECDFPVLCANITIDATEKSFAQENTVFALSDGTKVGIFGLDTPSTLTSSSPKNTAGLSFLTEDALYEAAQEQIDLLKEKGCSVIICLGHLGDEDINKGNNAIDVIENTSGLDIFIDGHDHLVKNEYIKDRDGKDVLHVETGCYLQNIGVITSDGSEFAESLVQAGNYEGSEQKIAEKVSEISEELQKSLGKKIAETAFDLNGERSPGNRDSETNLGDLTADAVLW